ncbi:hypothetical protein KKA94_02430 [Patescibacteria group bacterium]|nr:hypothetical protein [Patescibacteria group bacterium]
MNPPPHLPAKTCSVKTHMLFKFLPWAIFVILISALTGIIVSLSVVDWFLPSILPDARVITDGRIGSVNVASIDPLLDRQIKESVVSVYNKNEKVGESIYKESALVGRATILSSDGWAVMSAKEGATLRLNNIEVLDSKGGINNITKIISDSVSGLVYIKIEGEGYRVMALPQWDDVLKQDSLWQLTRNEYEEVYLGDYSSENDSSENLSISEPSFSYEILPISVTGGIILTNRGELAGFVDNGGRLLPSWLIVNQLSSVLSLGLVEYTGLPYQGYFVEVTSNQTRRQSTTGFYITYSPTVAGLSALGRTDVIIDIENEPIDRFDFARQILLAPDPINITILRGEELVDIAVPKIKL